MIGGYSYGRNNNNNNNDDDDNGNKKIKENEDITDNDI